MKQPSFFIIGAPKCGTTSLIQYLSTHKDVCVSEPKEPHYFLTDLPRYRMVSDLESYMSCFSCENDGANLLGEASTWYLFSNEAVPNILKLNPESKIIVILRNPVDMVISLFQQYLYGGEEDVEDFEKAWNLQETRLKGECIPPGMVEPLRLQYKEVCSLGGQLERVVSQVPKDQLKIIIFDDFIADTKKVYGETLAFLNLDSDDKIVFPIYNERKEFRLKFVTRLIRNNKISLYTNKLKRLFGIERIGLSDFILRRNVKKAAKVNLDENFRIFLTNEFVDDISKLEKLLDRDLDHWKR